MAQEKRKTVRKRTPQIVYVELGSDNGGILLNLSEGGCSFQAISPVQQGKLHFKFEIGEGRKIEGDAELAWSDDSRKLGGLRFVDLSNEVRSQIGTWLGQATPADRRFPSAAAKPQAPAVPSVDPSLKLKLVPPRPDTNPRTPDPDRSPRNIDVRSPEAKTGRGDTLADLVAEVFSEDPPSAPSPEPAPSAQSGRTRLQGDPNTRSTLPSGNARPKLSDSLAELAAEVFAETVPAQSALPAEPPAPTSSEVPSAAESEAKRRRARLRAEARLAATSHVDTPPGPPTETIPPRLEATAQASPVPSQTSPTHAPRVPQAWQNLAADPSPSAGRDYPVPTQSGAQIPKPPVRTDPLPSPIEPTAAHQLSVQVDTPIPPRAGHSAAKRSAGLGTGVAAIVVAAGLAAAVIFFHQQIGSSLIWLGGSLRGDSAATVVSPSSNARPAIPPASPGAAPASNDTTPGEEIAQQPLSSNGPAGSPTENEALSLWTATRNGDLHAQVLLGERMALGNGVKKNCDLARVLLTSALRKGNAEAKVKLDELPKLGCPAD